MKKADLTCIIDDDPIFVYGTKRMMQLANICTKFLVFSNGQEALDYLRPIMLSGENIPEIILLDLNMPVMDGWQFLEEFTEIKAKRPVTIYVVSSSIDPVDLTRAKNYSEITDYIIKPISQDRLRELFEEYSS